MGPKSGNKTILCRSWVEQVTQQQSRAEYGSTNKKETNNKGSEYGPNKSHTKTTCAGHVHNKSNKNNNEQNLDITSKTSQCSEYGTET